MVVLGEALTLKRPSDLVRIPLDMESYGFEGFVPQNIILIILVFHYAVFWDHKCKGGERHLQELTDSFDGANPKPLACCLVNNCSERTHKRPLLG